MKRTLLLLIAASLPLRALAQPAPPAASASAAPAASASAPRPDALSQAKELFRKGNALLQSNQNDLALDLFLQSRALVPGVGNTTNAAIALDRLGRFDEALAHYELVLKEFSEKLSDEERRTLGAAMTTLRRKVSTIDVAANVDGTVIIDGRKRGELPLPAPIRVLPGSHTIRVLKDGYAPAEAVVDARVGEEKAVDLRLEVLTSTGRLRVVDDTAGAETEVQIDGAPVGKAPWEGTLGVGRHLVVLQGKDSGSAPTVAAVIAGQSTVVSLRSTPTGPPLRIEPTPLDATVFLDDVQLGAGPWEGRLPLGTHQVRVVQEGYVTRSVTLDGATRGALRVELAIDQNHPRWRKLESARLLLEAHGGYGFGSSLGSDAEASCTGDCASRSGPGAVLVGARGVYLLPVGLAFELGGGFLRAATTFARSVPAARPAPGQSLHTYELSDDIAVSGPYAALGLGYRHRLPGGIRAVVRTSIGAHFASSRDAVTGEAARGTEREPIFLERSGRSARAVNFFLLPELGAELPLGRLHLGLGLGLALFLLDGPSSAHGDLHVTDGATRCSGDPTRLACVSADSSRAAERPYGPFRLWLPQLTVGYTF